MKKKNMILFLIVICILSVSITVNAEDCNGVFGSGFIDALREYVYKPIKWLTPIVLLLLTSIDFAGVVFNGEKDKMNKAKNNFLKRGVAALIIFFAPDLIILIVKFIDNQSISSCMNSLK